MPTPRGKSSRIVDGIPVIDPAILFTCLRIIVVMAPGGLTCFGGTVPAGNGTYIRNTVTIAESHTFIVTNHPGLFPQLKRGGSGSDIYFFFCFCDAGGLQDRNK